MPGCVKYPASFIHQGIAYHHFAGNPAQGQLYVCHSGRKRNDICRGDPQIPVRWPPRFSQNIGKCQYHAAGTARRFTQGDEGFVTEQRFSVAQLHGRHHSGHVPGREKLPPVFITQLQLHEDAAQEVPGRVTQSVNNVGQQLRHTRDVLLFVSTDYTQILLLPGFTEAKPVFQRDDAAADEVFEHFKPVMIPGRLHSRWKLSLTVFVLMQSAPEMR